MVGDEAARVLDAQVLRSYESFRSLGPTQGQTALVQDPVMVRRLRSIMVSTVDPTWNLGFGLALGLYCRVSAT